MFSAFLSPNKSNCKQNTASYHNCTYTGVHVELQLQLNLSEKFWLADRQKDKHEEDNSFFVILILRYKNRHARTHTHTYAQSMHTGTIVTLQYNNSLKMLALSELTCFATVHIIIVYKYYTFTFKPHAHNTTVQKLPRFTHSTAPVSRNRSQLGTDRMGHTRRCVSGLCVWGCVGCLCLGV